MAFHPVFDVVGVREACERARSAGQRVGFVPTMGALHAGHLALVVEARRRSGFVIASIFVNPTQFGPGEDFARYPRDLDGDLRMLASAGADMVFAPDALEIYPPGEETRVHVSSLTAGLEGARRPGHFDGVTTVVAKFFAIVGPCVAVFGRKDYQQLAVVRRMARDLMFPVDIVGHAIVRDPDGLAMSSRNRYLSPDERRRALSISSGLNSALGLFERGERDARALERVVIESIVAAHVDVDYVKATDAESLSPILGSVSATALLSVACRIGSTRLIDNVVLGEDRAPLAVARET